MVDPYDRSPAFEDALRNNPDCAAAAANSDSFESILQSAINVPVPEDLVDLAISQRNKDLPASRRINWMPAMAAGLAMGIGLTTAIFMYNGSKGQSIEQHLASHWAKDGDLTMQMAARNPMPADDVREVLAGLNLNADDALMNDIMYARNCGTPNGNGVHMVMRTESGPVTVIYMPATKGRNGQIMHLAGSEAMLTNTERGSFAVIGAGSGDLSTNVAFIKANLRESQPVET